MWLSCIVPKFHSKDWAPWWVVVYLWFAFFFAYVARQSIFSIFPILRSQLHFTEVQLGLTGTVFLWIYSLGNPIGGYLGDRFSKKKLVVLSVIVWSVCTLMAGTTQSVSGLLFWRGALALAQAPYIPVAITLITQMHSEYSRSTAISLHSTGQFLGIVFGGWYGGFVGESLGWRWMLGSVALAGILYGPVLYLLLGEKRQSQSDQAEPVAREKGSLAKVVLTPTYASFCLIFFAVCAMLWILYTWLPDFLRTKFHLSLASAGLTATAYVQLSIILGLFCGAPIGDRMMKRTKRGRLYVMLIGLSLCSPFFYLVAWAESLDQVRLAAVGYGFFLGLFNSNFFASVVDIVSKERQGFGIGFCNMIGGIAGGLAAFLVGLLKARFSVERLFGFAAGLGLGASVLLGITLWLFFLRDYHRAHPEFREAWVDG